MKTKNVVHNTGNRKTYTVIPSNSTTENTIQCNNTQNIEEKRNTQNETINTINLNSLNNTKCELVREDTSNTKNNPSIQQKEHKKFAFIIGDSMVKDIDGYLLIGSIKIKLIVKVRPFSSAKTVDMQDYIQPAKRDFDPYLYLLHVGTNDLLLEDTPEAISKRIIATAESVKKEHNEVTISNIAPRGDDLE